MKHGSSFTAQDRLHGGQEGHKCLAFLYLSGCRSAEGLSISSESHSREPELSLRLMYLGFPLPMTGGCMAACSSAPVIACRGSQVCHRTGGSPASAWMYEQKGGASHCWADRDGPKHSLSLGHLQVQHQSRALSLWQPETLGSAEVRKALAQLVALR